MLIDVSMSITPGSVFRLGTPPVEISSERFYHESEGEYESIMISCSAHTATHLDLVFTDRRVELERMIGAGKLIDASQVFDREISVADVKGQATIKPGDFVLFRTGWDRYAGTELYHDHPELSRELVQWLAEVGVNAVGIDALGLGIGRRHGEYDRLLARHNVYVIENLVNLDAVPAGPLTVYCFPLKIENTDAIPARVVVEIDGAGGAG